MNNKHYENSCHLVRLERLEGVTLNENVWFMSIRANLCGRSHS